MEKHGQIKVKPRENEKNKNLIMPVMQLVLFFMHINLKETPKEKNPPVLLCSTPSNQMHE